MNTQEIIKGKLPTTGAFKSGLNNFDSWGHDIGKNMYVYKPVAGPWQLYAFDLDWLMLVAGQRYSASNGLLFASQDPTVTRMYNHPPFRRAYFRGGPGHVGSG